MVDSWETIRATKDGRMVSMIVTLSEWLYNAVLGKDVLTLNRDYFRLRKPIERRVYELARKHCGKQDSWRIGMDTLHKKCGSAGTLRLFRQRVRDIAKVDHLPDYSVELDGDNIMFHSRANKDNADYDNVPTLDTETFHDAKIVAPGYDVYYLQQEWIDMWLASGKPKLDNPDAAFIGFCRKRHAMRPNP